MVIAGFSKILREGFSCIYTEDYLQFLRTKAPQYTIYFIFSNNLHICTTDVKHYNSNSCKCADGVQMVAEERGKSKEQRGKSGEQRLASLNLFLLSQVSNVKKIFFEKIEEVKGRYAAFSLEDRGRYFDKQVFCIKTNVIYLLLSSCNKN